MSIPRNNKPVGPKRGGFDTYPIEQKDVALARLAAIVDTSTDAIVSKNLDGIIQTWNKGAEQIFGYTAEEAIGQSIHIIIPHDRHQEEEMILEKLRKGERVNDFETVRRKKDGTHVDISLTVSPLRNSAGEVVGASKIARDITERKRAKATLEAQESELNLIAKTTPLILTRCSKDLRYLFVNKAAAEFFGRPVGEIVGQPIVEVMGEEGFAIIKPYIDKVLTGERIQYEAKIPFPNAGERWVQVNYLPEWDVNEDVVGWFASVADITERKNVETALQNLTETLEERVQKRKMQVKRLVARLVTAEQTERNRIAQLLHDDLQQMLIAIDIQLQFLGDSVQDTETFETILSFLNQAITLTRQLSVELSPPLIESRGLEETLRWVARDMGDKFQLQITVDGNELSRKAADDHRLLVYHIVRELLLNVVKHANAKKVLIQLKDDKDRIYVSVRDDGQGFNVQDMEENREYHFGLKSIQERLDLFDGTLEVESEPGNGSNITIILPSELKVDEKTAD